MLFMTDMTDVIECANTGCGNLKKKRAQKMVSLIHYDSSFTEETENGLFSILYEVCQKFIKT